MNLQRWDIFVCVLFLLWQKYHSMGTITWEVANVKHWLKCMIPVNVVQLLESRVSGLRVVVKVLGFYSNCQGFKIDSCDLWTYCMLVRHCNRFRVNFWKKTVPKSVRCFTPNYNLIFIGREIWYWFICNEHSFPLCYL